MKMNLVGSLLRVSAVLVTVTKVEGGGCTNLQTFGLPVIDMCERGNWTLGRVFISITTSNMGSNTRCNCTLRARTPGLQTNTTFQLRNVETNVSRCNESLILLTSPERTDITCTTRNESLFLTGHTTNGLIILLSRADALVGVSYCLYVQPVMSEANGLELICPSDQQPSISTTTLSTSTSSYPSSTSSTQSSTSSSPFVPRTPSASAVQTTLKTTPNSGSEDLADSTISVNAEVRKKGDSDFPTGAVVGGLMGPIALICLTVIVSIYIRYRYKADPPVSHEPGADNPAYDALSDITRVNLRADPNYAVIESERSSSQPSGNDTIRTTGVYETVDGASSATGPDTYVNNANNDRGTQTYYNV